MSELSSNVPGNGSAFASRWLLRRPRIAPRMRLICFSYAGGSGSVYLQWQPQLPATIEVVGIQLPGRGSRISETPHRSLRTLVATLAAEIAPLDDLPFAFFGHSLGALVAFDVARYQQRHQLTMPRRLIVSGCDAPQFRSPIRNLHELDGEAFIKALAQYNGTPPELLAHKELMSLVAPAIRADFFIAANYEYSTGTRLSIPVTVLAGRDDHDLNLDKIGSWQLETSGPFDLHWFDGDHFFLNTSRGDVLALISSNLVEMA